MIAQLSPSDFAQWLQAQTGSNRDQASGNAHPPMVLDVREPSEINTACVPVQGFVLTAIPMHEIPARLHELAPQTPIACLCHHGVRSLQVAYFLQQHGFLNVVNIKGGIDAWSRELDASIPLY